MMRGEGEREKRRKRRDNRSITFLTFFSLSLTLPLLVINNWILDDIFRQFRIPIVAYISMFVLGFILYGVTLHEMWNWNH